MFVVPKSDHLAILQNQRRVLIVPIAKFRKHNCTSEGHTISVPKTRRDPIERIPLTLEFKTRRQLIST